jgi:hypothetical protein
LPCHSCEAATAGWFELSPSLSASQPQDGIRCVRFRGHQRAIAWCFIRWTVLTRLAGFFPKGICSEPVYFAGPVRNRFSLMPVGAFGHEHESSRLADLQNFPRKESPDVGAR